MPIKEEARALASAAIRRGELVRGPCEVCGTTPTDAHHDDYSRPLGVRWLCKSCHRKHHIENGYAPGINRERTVDLRLPLELREPLRQAAAAEDRTIANLIVHALRLYLAGRDRPATDVGGAQAPPTAAVRYP